MKRILIVFLVTLIALSFISESEYKLKEGEAIKTYEKLRLLVEILPQSELPAKDASKHIKETSEILQVLEAQYKKNHPDTTKVKK